ncbi:MAG: creatininase family protein, partial [Bacteroidia bacterium]|nr:creatininase family protein [Bacteroidia bacterium]
NPNGHGGNDFKQLVRDLQPEFPEMLISIVEWFRLFPNSQHFEEDGDHANEMETSIILHYFPHLVLPLEQAGDGTSKKFRMEALYNKTAWTPRRWDKVSADTGVGNPKKASAEKGFKFLEDVTTKIADYFVDLAKSDLEDLYE